MAAAAAAEEKKKKKKKKKKKRKANERINLIAIHATKQKRQRELRADFPYLASDPQRAGGRP